MKTIIFFIGLLLGAWIGFKMGDSLIGKIL